MSKVDIHLFDKEVPFQCSIWRQGPWPNKPFFSINPAQGFNKKSKAAAKGFVINDKTTALEFVGRLLCCVVAIWPETKEHFRSLMKEE